MSKHHPLDAAKAFAALLDPATGHVKPPPATGHVKPPHHTHVEVSGTYRGKDKVLGSYRSLDEAHHAVAQLPGVLRVTRDLDEGPDETGNFGRLSAADHHSIDFESDPEFKHLTDEQIDRLPSMKWAGEFYLRHHHGKDK